MISDNHFLQVKISEHNVSPLKTIANFTFTYMKKFNKIVFMWMKYHVYRQQSKVNFSILEEVSVLKVQQDVV